MPQPVMCTAILQDEQWSACLHSSRPRNVFFLVQAVGEVVPLADVPGLLFSSTSWVDAHDAVKAMCVTLTNASAP